MTAWARRLIDNRSLSRSSRSPRQTVRHEPPKTERATTTQADDGDDLHHQPAIRSSAVRRPCLCRARRGRLHIGHHAGAEPAPESSVPAATAGPTLAPSPSVTPADHRARAPVTPAPSPTAVPVIGEAPGRTLVGLPLAARQAPCRSDRPRSGVYGWSGGYVAFEQSAAARTTTAKLPVTIRSSSSRDGIHWTAPVAVDLGAAKARSRSRPVVEGPPACRRRLLPGDTCGGPAPITAPVALDGRARPGSRWRCRRRS